MVRLVLPPRAFRVTNPPRRLRPGIPRGPASGAMPPHRRRRSRNLPLRSSMPGPPAVCPGRRRQRRSVPPHARACAAGLSRDLIRMVSSAASRNEMASMAIARSRPRLAATSPPKAAPTAAIVPQVDSSRNDPSARSSGATTCPSDADVAGVMSALSPARIDITPRTIGTAIPRSVTNGVLIVSRVLVAAAAARLDQTTIFLRSRRSASTPPKGEKRNAGRVLAVRTAAVSRGESLSS